MIGAIPYYSKIGNCWNNGLFRIQYSCDSRLRFFLLIYRILILADEADSDTIRLIFIKMIYIKFLKYNNNKIV